MKTNNLIIILLVANLSATIWFGVADNASKVEPSITDVSVDTLPDVLNSDIRNSIVNRFEEAFNSKNYSGLYNMFGPLAQAQVSEEEVKKQFIKLNDLFGTVKDGAFSHSEFVGKQGSKKVYALNYVVKIPDSDFTNKGTLKVTVGVEGSDYEIYGIHLTGG